MHASRAAKPERRSSLTCYSRPAVRPQAYFSGVSTPHMCTYKRVYKWPTRAEYAYDGTYVLFLARIYGPAV